MSDRGFYVGFLPLPARHGRFLRVVAPALVLGLAALGFLVATSQRDPGDASWQDGRPQAWTGTLVTRPYPILITGEGSAILVVEMGKHGARDALRFDSPRLVELSGWLLERGGRRMIELEPGSESIELLGDAAEPALLAGDQIELTGEILDSKCYLGAMKPGEGKTHKACATLCIAGGIPPMLYTIGPDGSRRHYLLAGPDGDSARELVLDFVGEPVIVRGRRSRIADMNLLLIEPGGLSRR
jgi:hypothetical protein